MTVKNERVGFIDEVRGFAILCMVVYHAAFDLVSWEILSIGFFSSIPMNTVRDLFAALFIFISGASCRLSRSNLKRGLLLAFIAAAVTLFTYLLQDILGIWVIWFGILHILAFTMVLFSLTRSLLDKLKPLTGIIISGALFLLCYPLLNEGGIGIPFLYNYRLSLINSKSFLLGFLLPLDSFYSGDYFPLIPWIFIFITGSYFGVYIKERRLPEFFYKTKIPFLAWIGRHTLWIYIAHQPIIMGILMLLFSEKMGF